MSIITAFILAVSCALFWGQAKAASPLHQLSQPLLSCDKQEETICAHKDLMPQFEAELSHVQKVCGLPLSEARLPFVFLLNKAALCKGSTACERTTIQWLTQSLTADKAAAAQGKSCSQTQHFIQSAKSDLMQASAKNSAEAFADCSRESMSDLARSEFSAMEIAKKVFETCRERLPFDIRYLEHYEEMMVPQLAETVEALRKAQTPDYQK